MEPIYLYSPAIEHKQIYAVHPIGLEKTTTLLKSRIDHSRIVTLPDRSYLNRELTKVDKGTLVIPGGSFLFLNESVYGGREERYSTHNVIKKFVSRGGAFLGTCSGAMIASEALIQEVENNQSSGPYFLNLLPVEARLPVYTLGKKMHDAGDNSRIVSVLSEEEEPWKAYWNEGCKFTIKRNQPGLKIEACYGDIPDAPIAAISGRCGKGRVFLQGMHPETDFPDESEENLLKREGFFEGSFKLLNEKG